MADAPTKDIKHEQREAEIIARHLDPAYHGEFDGTPASPGSEDGSYAGSTQESSLRLQGGDVHRDLYRIDARSKRARLHQRAATFTALTPRPTESDPDHVPIENQRAPGGFRRQFLQRHHSRFDIITLPVTHNFVEFLDLYGNFAGEDLAESEDESAVFTDEEEAQSGETRPLLGHRRSTRVRAKGDASVIKSFFTLLKAFIGTGIMFLPKAFKNGGMLFSSLLLLTVALLSCVCFHLLLQCRKRYGGGYGEIGDAIGGRRLRILILISIAISQIGFVCAGIIFVAENLYSFLDAVTPKATTPFSTTALIAFQLIALMPLALIRNISKLGPAALLADVFILIGLTYIYWYDISTILSRGGLHPTIELFNPHDFTLTVGSAIFTFEGIGLILPIQSSMREPEKFSHLLYLVMALITVIFTSVGFLCYGTFGDRTSTEIISNFPQSSKLVNAVQFLYALAVLVGTPVQLFPALRIIEGKLFGRLSGKRDRWTKWKKNALRTVIVLLCGVIAGAGANDLDKFVALIGSFACVPLVYIYPAFLHYKGVAETRQEKWGDLLLMVVGVIAMIYTTSITLVRWSEG